MKKNKVLYKTILIIIAIITIISNFSTSYAALSTGVRPEQSTLDGTGGGAGGSEEDEDSTGSGLTGLPSLDSFQASISLGGASTIVGGILWVLMIVGTVLIVVSLALIGFLTILGSASEKADYQQKLVGVIFAGIFMVASSSIAKLIISVAITF